MVDLIGGKHKANIIQLKLGRTEGYTGFEPQHLSQLTPFATAFSKADGAAHTSK
jgi:hypothetical protein